MRGLKVCFLHERVRTRDDIIRFLRIDDLPLSEYIILDNDAPDYVIATDFINSEPDYADRFRRLVYDRRRKTDPIRIFWTEECISPDLNLFDYAICWNWNLSCGDRISRIPPHIFIRDIMPSPINTMTFDEAKRRLAGGLDFCSFIYSNDTNASRGEIFKALSSYRHVDSPGAYMNNMGVRLKFGEGWQEESIRVKSLYKFAIAAENAISDGYTSEKLLTSFMAHTVPIYWGNPYVTEEYNPEAFVNLNSYETLDDAVRRVREIDEDNDLWARMVSAPWQTEEQRKASDRQYASYLAFIENIFTQPHELARRRTKGTWNDLYEMWYFDGFLLRKEYTLPERLMKFLKSPDKIFSLKYYRDKIQRISAKPLKEINADDFRRLKEK